MCDLLRQPDHAGVVWLWMWRIERDDRAAVVLGGDSDLTMVLHQGRFAMSCLHEVEKDLPSEAGRRELARARLFEGVHRGGGGTSRCVFPQVGWAGAVRRRNKAKWKWRAELHAGKAVVAAGG